MTGPHDSSFFDLRASMENASKRDLEEYDREDLDPGFHPRIHDTGYQKTFVIVKYIDEREKNRGRGHEPSNCRLEIFKLADLSAKRMRLFQEKDKYEVEELKKDELWNRLACEDTNFLFTSEMRGKKP